MYIDVVSAVVERLNESSDHAAVERADLILADHDLIRGRIEHARGHGAVAMLAAEMPREVDGTASVSERLHESFDQRMRVHGLNDLLFAFDLSRQITRCTVERDRQLEDTLRDGQTVLSAESFGKEVVAVVFQGSRPAILLGVDVPILVVTDGHWSRWRRLRRWW